MHYYNFNIKDYISHTVHLSNEEDLAYRRLLDFYYESESPIPLNTQSVSRRLRIGYESVTTILQEFFFEREDGWHHLRCDEEIASYHRKSSIARANGKLGGKPKKTNKQPIRNLSVTNPVPIRELTNNQEPITNNKTLLSEYSDEFEQFWKLYPKRTGKGAAWQSWKKQKPFITEVIAALSWQKDSPDWIKDGGQFIPMPSTYLNQRRWQDEATSKVKSNTLDAFYERIGA